MDIYQNRVAAEIILCHPYIRPLAHVLHSLLLPWIILVQSNSFPHLLYNLCLQARLCIAVLAL